MLTSRLRKFTDLYDKFGLGATKNLHLICQIMILGRTCSLWKLKDYVGAALGTPLVQPTSHYQRLIRFFNAYHEDEAFLLAIQQRTFRLLRRFKFTHLLLDGTSWKRGGQNYHYMVLSVLVGSVAVPLYWKQLSKIGASSQDERKQLFEAALEHFDLQGMTLLADREYVGKEWFKFLTDNNIDFVIRLRFSDYYQVVDAAPGKTYQQMYDQCVGQGKFCRKRIELGNYFYFLSMRPNPKASAVADGEGVIIFLTRLRPVKKTVDQYIKRWRIECLFRHLKSNGFGLEDHNLKPVTKSNLLMAIVGMAYSLTIRVGYHADSAIRRVTYRDGTVFPAESIFRRGLSLMTPYCSSIGLFLERNLSLIGRENHLICKNVE